MHESRSAGPRFDIGRLESQHFTIGVMNRMRTSRILIAVFGLSLLAVPALIAQPGTATGGSRAISGKDGVYLIPGTQILHPDRPVNGMVGYNLYRRSPGGSFARINDRPVSRVSTQQEFDGILGRVGSDRCRVDPVHLGRGWRPEEKDGALVGEVKHGKARLHSIGELVEYSRRSIPPCD